MRRIHRLGNVTIMFGLALFFLTGCWDRTEINDLAIITAAGIDRSSDHSIELTAAVFIPKGQGGGQQMGGGSSSGPNQQVVVRSATGVTIADAMSKLQQKFPRKLFWGHATVFVLGRDLAKGNVLSDLDFLLREPEIRENAHLFISKQKAKDVLSLTPPLERDLAKVLRELSKLKIGMDVTIKDMSKMLLDDSGAAAVPFISILPPEGTQSGTQTIPVIKGTAVFKRGKMIGTINPEVSRGILWLRNEVKLAVVTIRPKHVNGNLSMQLLRVHSALTPKIENGQWKITLKALTEDDIIQNDTPLDTMNPRVIKRLEEDLSQTIARRIRQAIKQAQKMNADIFNFAGAFHRDYPADWKKASANWDDIFPNVDVKIVVDAKIKRPGLTTFPTETPKDEVEND